MENIVVTGATSMLGIALIEAALRDGEVRKIYAVVREDTQKVERLPKDSRVELVRCGIEDYKSLPDKIRNADVFYYFAWKLTGRQRNTDIHVQADNIGYALDALSAAAKLGCNKFVGAGSQAEYGDTVSEKMSPDTPANPADAYGTAKFCAGKLARQEAERLGMDCFWVRVLSVYGEYDTPTTMVSSTVAALMRGESPEFTPAGNIWDFLYSGDAGKAFYMIGKNARGNKIYCLGSGEGRLLREYIETIGRIVNPDVNLRIGVLPYPNGAPRNIRADISELSRDTGWSPETSFDEGIRRVLLFMREREKA